MEQFPAAKETQPHGPADLTDQSTVFLMLEELGIASMQRDWLEANVRLIGSLKIAECSCSESGRSFCFSPIRGSCCVPL